MTQNMLEAETWSLHCIYHYIYVCLQCKGVGVIPLVLVKEANSVCIMKIQLTYSNLCFRVAFCCYTVAESCLVLDLCSSDQINMLMNLQSGAFIVQMKNYNQSMNGFVRNDVAIGFTLIISSSRNNFQLTMPISCSLHIECDCRMSMLWIWKHSP